MMCCARGRADPEGDSAEDCAAPDDVSGGAGAEELSAPGAFEDEEHPDSTTTSATATAPTAIPQARRGVGERGRGCSGGVTGFPSGRCHRGRSPRSGTVQRQPQLPDASVDRDPDAARHARRPAHSQPQPGCRARGSHGAADLPKCESSERGYPGVVLTRVSRSGCDVGPGQADGLDLFGGGLGGRVCTILGGDQDSAEGDEHVLVAGVGLGGVPARPGTALGGDTR